ncbi:protoporphyrinogen oxidase [Botrimarina hoheduenensis]|uniref:protoporphyrinogen oxidase n=1 Tax=Botrimarina hoheduenensis TaxID=2528000 RepID=UPI0018D3632F|nr:protoporphyrinogen oxidase [Botrimarina hoheduenensis]
MHRSPRIAILGGGITGLAAAQRLTELAAGSLEWCLFESTARLGGVLQTVQEGDWRIELSADNFLTREPWARDLCHRVGLAEALLDTNTDRRGAYLVHRGRLVPVPPGFVLMSASPLWPTIASPLLSPLGKLRLLAEPLMPRGRQQGEPDESVADFARRRLGPQALERLVQPLVGGIYTADPERLSMAATLPQFLEQEAQHGSLWRAALRRARTAVTPVGTGRKEAGANYALFQAPAAGMQQLVDAVVGRLPAERLYTGVEIARCERQQNGWRLIDAMGQVRGDFAAVIITLPAYAAAATLPAGTLADELRRIEYASSSVVCLGVRDEQITRPMNGFGFVTPAREGRRLIAASFSSYKFPGRAPAGHTLIRVFVGGALQPELAELEEPALLQLVQEELGELIGLRGVPILTRIVRWPRRMPQYHVGHLQRVDRIEQLAREYGGLHLAGAAYRGVGVPQCVHAGQLAAEQASAELAQQAPATGA